MATSAKTSGEVKGQRPKRPSRLRRNIIYGAVGAVFLWALLDVGIRWDRLFELTDPLEFPFFEFLATLGDFFGRMFLPPDWDYLPIAWEGMVASIQMAWFGTVIGAVLSLPMAFLASRNVSGGVVSSVARLILDAIRAVPELILALIVFIPIAGLGPVAGALAIGIHSIGTLGKLSAEAIESIDEGPVEASRAVGANNWQTQRFGVIPQVLPEIVAFWLYRFEINLRAGVVLGIVGAGGVGTVLFNTLNYRRWDKAGMTVLVIIVATILIDQGSGWVRRRIIEGSGGKPSAGEEALTELYRTGEAKTDTTGGIGG